MRQGAGKWLIIAGIFGALVVYGRFLPGREASSLLVTSPSVGFSPSMPPSFFRCVDGPKIAYLPSNDGNSGIAFCGWSEFRSVKPSIDVSDELEWSANRNGPWMFAAGTHGICQEQRTCGGSAVAASHQGYYRVRQVVTIPSGRNDKSAAAARVTFSKVVYSPRTSVAWRPLSK